MAWPLTALRSTLVISGGGNLNRVTSLLKATAEKSFNYQIPELSWVRLVDGS